MSTNLALAQVLKEEIKPRITKQANIRVNRHRCKHTSRRRNMYRRSFKAKIHWLQPSKKKRSQRLTLKKARIKLKHLKKLRHGKVFIRVTRRNTFLTLVSFNKRKKKNFIKFKCSVGALKYTNKQKRSYLARTELATLFGKRICAKHYHLIDVYFVSKMGKFYRLVVKGLGLASVKKNKLVLLIRRYVIRRIRGHGLIRSKKKRRI